MQIVSFPCFKIFLKKTWDLKGYDNGGYKDVIVE